MTPYEMFLSAVGARDDPSSGGRQMPSHWGHKRLNIVTQSSATGTQCVQAIGCADAGLLYSRLTAIPDRESRFKHDEIVYLSLGDGSSSERRVLGVVEQRSPKAAGALLIEDNGYAISCRLTPRRPAGICPGSSKTFLAEAPGVTERMCSRATVRWRRWSPAPCAEGFRAFTPR
jgi:2-oxoisovalerate dehydrogenase E1 component